MPNNEMLLKKLRLAPGASDEDIQVAYEKLKHTYELVLLGTNDEDIKEIAKKKLDELKQMAPVLEQSVALQYVHEGEYEEVVNAAYRMFEGKKVRPEDAQAMIRKLERIAQTSENYYLQTLMYLEVDNGYDGCALAKQTIENALVIEPNNMVYLGLREGIDSVIQARIDFQEAERRRLEQERLMEEERARQLEAEARRERCAATCGTIGECLCGLIGIVFQCVCSCCSCCDSCS